MYAIRSYYGRIGDNGQGGAGRQAGRRGGGLRLPRPEQRAEGVVITSYSIHYTKLYDAPAACSRVSTPTTTG